MSPKRIRIRYGIFSVGSKPRPRVNRALESKNISALFRLVAKGMINAELFLGAERLY